MIGFVNTDAKLQIIKMFCNVKMGNDCSEREQNFSAVGKTTEK